MRQRVKLAQAIAHDPEVLLLDEPVTGMDPVNRRRVVDLVKAPGARGQDRRGLEPHPARGRGDDAAGAARSTTGASWPRATCARSATCSTSTRTPWPSARASRGALAAAVVGWPHVLSVQLRPGGRVAHGRRPRARTSSTARSTTPALEAGVVRDVLARRGPRVGLQVPGGAMRDTARPLPFGRGRAGRLRPRRSRAWSGAAAAC